MSFKITRGSLDDPPSDLILDRVCRTVRSELLPCVARTVPLKLWTSWLYPDLPLTQADMSLSPAWYTLGVRSVESFGGDISELCLLSLPSLDMVHVLGVVGKQDLPGFGVDTPRTKAGVWDTDIKIHVDQKLHKLFSAEGKRCGRSQKSDFILHLSVKFGDIGATVPGGDEIDGQAIVSEPTLPHGPSSLQSASKNLEGPTRDDLNQYRADRRDIGGVDVPCRGRSRWYDSVVVETVRLSCWKRSGHGTVWQSSMSQSWKKTT